MLSTQTIWPATPAAAYSFFVWVSLLVTPSHGNPTWQCAQAQILLRRPAGDYRRSTGLTLEEITDCNLHHTPTGYIRRHPDTGHRVSGQAVGGYSSGVGSVLLKPTVAPTSGPDFSMDNGGIIRAGNTGAACDTAQPCVHGAVSSS